MRSFLRNLGQIVPARFMGTLADLVPDGSIADQQTVAAGLVVNPDGSDFSKVVNADNSYTVYYEDAQGDTTAYQYSTGGTLPGSYRTTGKDSSSTNGSGVKPKPSRCALRRPQRAGPSPHRPPQITLFAIRSIASSECPESA